MARMPTGRGSSLQRSECLATHCSEVEVHDDIRHSVLSPSMRERPPELWSLPYRNRGTGRPSTKIVGVPAAPLARSNSSDRPRSSLEMDMGLELLAGIRSTSSRPSAYPSRLACLERLLTPKEQVVHGPEPLLRGRRLARLSRCERVRMDLDEREMAEGEAVTERHRLRGIGRFGTRARVYGHS